MRTVTASSLVSFQLKIKCSESQPSAVLTDWRERSDVESDDYRVRLWRVQTPALWGNMRGVLVGEIIS